MYWYEKLDRFALLLALIWAGYFLITLQIATAVAMILLWLTTRAVVCWADVFCLFFTERSLVHPEPATDAKVQLADTRTTKRTESFQRLLGEELMVSQ